MHLPFKLHTHNAKAPVRAHAADAGFDLTATGFEMHGGVFVYSTGVSVSIPRGYVGLLKERSSVRNRGVVLVGGVIDSGYTGQIEVSFQRVNQRLPIYDAGDRICQLVIVPVADFQGAMEVPLNSPFPTRNDSYGEFPPSPEPEYARGSSGFGSTGA